MQQNGQNGFIHLYICQRHLHNRSNNDLYTCQKIDGQIAQYHSTNKTEKHLCHTDNPVWYS